MKNQIVLLGAMGPGSSLRGVPEEVSSLNNLFSESKLSVEIRYEPYLTNENLDFLLNDCEDKIAILHFAGHSNSTEIIINDDVVHSKKIALLFSSWEHVPELVFLNGCYNANQVREFHKSGVAFVIATKKPIDDKEAADFAKKFYSELLKKPFKTTLLNAFKRAGYLTLINESREPRSLDIDDITEKSQWDWGIYPNLNKSPKSVTLHKLVGLKTTTKFIFKAILLTVLAVVLIASIVLGYFFIGTSFKTQVFMQTNHVEPMKIQPFIVDQKETLVVKVKANTKYSYPKELNTSKEVMLNIKILFGNDLCGGIFLRKEQIEKNISTGDMVHSFTCQKKLVPGKLYSFKVEALARCHRRPKEAGCQTNVGLEVYMIGDVTFKNLYPVPSFPQTK